MNVYQRPLFRQAGGPVAPEMAQAPMPQQAAMQPSQDQVAMLQAAEQMAAQETQGLGAQYAQDTLASLDAAETPEQVINAIRGNEMPLQARYEELAQYVGEEDAGQTPQSVLALVQPTLMMTEEGAMNSGIGDLMRNITGEIDMITEEGVPTDMGQGVGSLMMAGVGQQPVANFSQGGAVQHFQTGGEASRLQQLYSEMLPVYQGIMGDGEEARRMSQAQILFDIADRAGAFAAGIDPRSGQSVAGLSPAAQLAAATTGLGGQIGQRMAGLEEQDRALKLAALQAAQGEYSAERAAARAAAGRERGIGEEYEAVDAEGNVVASEFLANRDDLDAFRAAYPDATIRVAREPVTPSFESQTLFGPEGEVVTINRSTPQGVAQGESLLAQGYTDQEPPTPEGSIRVYDPNNLQSVQLVEENSPEMRQAYQMGFRTLDEIKTMQELSAEPEGDTLTERQQLAITNQETLDNLENLDPQALSRFATNVAAFIRETTSPAGVSSRLPIPPNTQEAMRRAHAAGISFPGIDPSLYGAAPRADEYEATALQLLDPDTDISEATGLLSPLRRGANLLGELFAGEFGFGPGTIFEDTAQGGQALNALAAATRRFYLDGRTLALEFSLLQEELARPSLLRSPADAVRKLSAQRSLLEGDLQRVQEVLANPSGYSSSAISEARKLETYARQLLATYDEYISAFSQSQSGLSPNAAEAIRTDPAFALPQ